MGRAVPDHRPVPDRRAAPTEVTLAALGLALASAAWRLTRRPLWIDEAFSLGATNQLARTIGDTGGTMALYYVLLDGWTAVFGSSVLALRALSVTLVLVGIVVLSRLTHRILPPGPAGLSLLVVAVMPAMVRLAQDARAYALVVVVTVSCWACLTRAVEADATGDRSASRRWALALAPLMAAGTLSHGLFLLQVPALVLSVAVHLRRRSLLVALIPALAAGAATLAALLVLGLGDVGDWILPLHRDQVGALVDHLLAPRWPLRTGMALLAVGGAVVALRRRPADPVDRWKAAVPVWWAATAPVLIIALSVVRPSLLGRYVSGSIPAIGILIAIGLHALWRAVAPAEPTPAPGPLPAPRRILGALLVVAVLGAPPLDRLTRAGPVTFEDWDAVADHVGAHARPGDGLAFMPIGGERDNPDLLRAPFEAAWTGRSGPRVDVVPLSPARPLGQVRRFDETLDPTTLSARMADHDRVWVVMVPGGWATFLDVLAREPAASQLRREPTATFNGGMQVVLLTRR